MEGKGGFDVGERKMAKGWVPMTARSPVQCSQHRCVTGCSERDDNLWLGDSVGCGEHEAEFREHGGAVSKVDHEIR